MQKTHLLIVIAALAAPAALATALAVQHTAPSAAHPEDAVTQPNATAAHAPSDAAKVARDVARAVMSKKSALAEACWIPLVAKQAEPARSRHVLRETFDAEGKEVSRAVEEIAGQSRADVADCLRALPLDVEIAKAERPTTVAVTIAFP